MHKVSEDISLIAISLTDYKKLHELMWRIYPPVYGHLWPDKGERYLNKLYSKENVEDELKNPNSRYYFVSYKSGIVGILKILLNEDLPGTNTNFAIKLQRIYLDSSVQGKGVGKKLVHWTEREFSTREKSILWLEVMDSQVRAIKFYENLGFKIVADFRFESALMLENCRGMYIMCRDQ